MTFLRYLGYFIVSILCLLFMIVVHEGGHFLAGRLLGFKINEFAVGFGPKIFSKRSKKTGILFSLRLILFGGFCDFYGEMDLDKKENDKNKINFPYDMNIINKDKPIPFAKQKPWKRIIVMFAGAFFNYLSAVLLLFIFLISYGNKVPEVRNAYNITDKPGYTQAFKEKDKILEIDGKNVYLLLGSGDFVKQLQNKDKIRVKVQRNNKIQEIVAQKGKYMSPDDKGKMVESTGFGIWTGQTTMKYSFFKTIELSFVFSIRIILTILSTLGMIITGIMKPKGNLGGPVTLISSMMGISAMGFAPILFAIATMSTMLAVMNLLPVPSLDGSKIFFTTLEWIRKKPINPLIEGIIHITGFILLFVVAIILDIVNWL